MRETLLLILVVGMGGFAYWQIEHEQPKLRAELQTRLVESQEENRNLAAEVKALKEDAIKDKRDLARFEQIGEEKERIAKVDQARAVEQTIAAKMEEEREEEINGFEREVRLIQAQIVKIRSAAQMKTNQLRINEGQWLAQLKQTQSLKGNFQEQRISKSGKASGVRTSQSDRSAFEQKKQARITQINNQLAVIESEVVKIENEKNTAIEKLNNKISSLRRVAN